MVFLCAYVAAYRKLVFDFWKVEKKETVRAAAVAMCEVTASRIHVPSPRWKRRGKESYAFLDGKIARLQFPAANGRKEKKTIRGYHVMFNLKKCCMKIGLNQPAY